MPHSPSEITPQRLDELQGEYSLRYEDRECKCETTDVAACRCCRGLCVCHDDFDTLAALRAYREAIDTIEVIEQTVETQRAHISLLREQLESAMSHACDCNCTCWEQEFQSWPHLIAHMRGATAPTEAQETRSAESKAECPECFGEGAIPMSNGYERRTCGYCKGFGVIDVHP